MPELFKALGIFVWVAAGWLIYVSLNMNVGVAMPADTAEFIGTDTIANSHAMHVQMMAFLAGAFLSLNGSVLFVGGFLLGKGDPQPEIEG